MNNMSKVVPAVIILAGVGILSWWLLRGEGEIPLRVPGTDITAEQMKEREAAASGQGVLTAGAGNASSLAGSWPRFRNSNFDNISTETVALNTDWPASGPPVLWKLELGEGHAGAAVLAGRVYILDYDREKEKDVLRCLSLDDGAEIWNYAYPVKIKRNHGMSRTVPAVTEKYLVTLGPKCHVHCLDPVTGKFYWMIDLVKEYQTVVPPWYAGQCPLIDGERVILAPGGSALMIAVDGASGKVIWQSPNPGKWDMTHSSIIPMTFKNKKMYVYCGRGGVAGVAAEDGRILWQTDEWKISIATISSPVVVGEDRIFLSGGYNAGCMMIRLKEEPGAIGVETVFRLDAKVFGSPQHTPILYEGHIYGVRPDGQMTCLSPEGEIRWTSGAKNRFGLGPYLIADRKLIMLDDSGLLSVAEAAPGGYVPLAQAKVLSGHDAWAPMALAAERLILRDLTQMICLDLTGK